MTEPRGRDARNALFGPPQRIAPQEEGRRAVFSAPPRRKGTVVIECGRCQARTPVALVELGPRLVPSLWIPCRDFPRLLRCPACRRFAWSRVHWRTVLG